MNYYRPKRSFGQGNIFTSVCHSFCSRGVYFFGGGVFFRGGVLHRNTVNVRPVRILLECILVQNILLSSKRLNIKNTENLCVCCGGSVILQEGRQTPYIGCPGIFGQIFHENCMKWRKLDGGKERGVPDAPLNPPMVCFTC